RTGDRVDLVGGGSGTNHRLTARGASLGNAARSDVASDSPAGKVNTATTTHDGVSSGTTAAIDTGATIDANSAAVNARQKFTLETLTGGFGGAAGGALGLGVSVVTVDADVSAFIAPGTTVNALSINGRTLAANASR